MEANERSDEQLLKIILRGHTGAGKSRAELYARGWTAVMLETYIEDFIGR